MPLYNNEEIKSNKGVANGYAGLDANAYLPETIFPLDKRKPEVLAAFGLEINFTRNRVYFSTVLPTDLALPTISTTNAVEGCWSVIFHQDLSVGDDIIDIGNYIMYGAYVKGLVNRITLFYMAGEVMCAIDQPNVKMTALSQGLLTEFPQLDRIFQGQNIQPIFTATALRNYNIIWRKYADAAKNSPTQLQTGSRYTNTPSHDFTVDLCAITNQTLSGTPTIDGVSSSNRSVLLIGQTNKAENGVYDVSTGGVWTRSTSMDSGTEYNYKTIYVSGGTVEKGKSFRSRFRYPAIVWGTSDLIFDEITFERILLSTDSSYVGFLTEVRNGLGQYVSHELPTPIIFKTTTDVAMGTKSATNSDVITTETSGFGTANDIDVLTASGTRADTTMQLAFNNTIQTTTDYHYINFMLFLESMTALSDAKFSLRIFGGLMNDIHANGALRTAVAPSTTDCDLMNASAGRPAISVPFVTDRWMPFRVVFRKTDTTGSYSLAFRLENIDVTTASKMKVLVFDNDNPTTVRTIKRLTA